VARKYHVMVTLLNFLVPRRKVRLMPTARMSCSNAANIDLDAKLILRPAKFRYGARAPIMYIYCTSPGDRQTSCKVWLTSVERRWCSNETRTRNPLKLAGVPHHQLISAVGQRSPYCEALWKRYCCLPSFFPIVDRCLSCDNTAR